MSISKAKGLNLFHHKRTFIFVYIFEISVFKLDTLD